MTGTPPVIRAIPGPGFVATLLVSSWLDTVRGAGEAVPWLLLGHAGPRRNGETLETVEDGLLGMVAAMRLSPAAERVPAIGARLLIGGRLTALDYGHPTCVLRIPSPGAEWREAVARGAQACVTLLLDPLPPGAGPDAIGAIIDRCTASGRVFMGATTARGR
ncbi:MULTISPECIES: hypothetical protein [Streptomyces]|uniref:Uncharacterized protein n=1 Tax=[Kitasatospora] papulosa TaxID=1464011 RepID=A0ABZ1K639_9ACTN